MSLIIKGMEMLQAGDVIICGQIDGKLQCTIVTRGKPTKWCEVSEISAPHGRLVDSNELLDDFMKAYPVGSPDLGCAFEIIENAETFIKAEVSEE